MRYHNMSLNICYGKVLGRRHEPESLLQRLLEVLQKQVDLANRSNVLTGRTGKQVEFANRSNLPTGRTGIQVEFA